MEKPPVAARRATARPAELGGPKAPIKRLSFFAVLAAMKKQSVRYGSCEGLRATHLGNKEHVQRYGLITIR